MASAKARTQTECMPPSVLAQLASCSPISISGAPPPATRKRFLTSERTTQSASCSERSVSSSTSLFEPRTSRLTVWPLLGTPVTLTTLWPWPTLTSSTSSAEPSLAAVKESTLATGWQPSVLAMNSTSSRSTSRTTRIFILARKCSDRSLTLSRRMDFCTSSTLQPLACTFLQMSRM